MKTSNLLFIFLIAIAVPVAFAETEIGEKYTDRIIKDLGQGVTIHEQVIQLTPRVLDGNQYQNYIFTDEPNYLQVETSGSSVRLDKTTCEFTFYNKRNLSNPLLTDSIIAYQSVTGSGVWNTVNAINNASCDASWNGSELSAMRSAGVGSMEYVYILKDGTWKTELRVLNESGLNDRHFGFEQIFNLNRDTVVYAGQLRNLDNFDGQTFDRTFLENNEANVIELLNGHNFDFDIAFENLNNIWVSDTGVDSSQLTFQYFHDQPILLNGTKLVLDPTFTDTSATYGTVKDWSGDVSTTCSGLSFTHNSGQSKLYKRDGDVAVSPVCQSHYSYFDITSLEPDIKVNKVEFIIDVDASSGFLIDWSCEYHTMELASGSVGATQATWDDIIDGTLLLDSDTDCRNITGKQVKDFGQAGINWVQTAIDSGDSEVGVGASFNNPNTRQTDGNRANYHEGSPPQLRVTYTAHNDKPDRPSSIGTDGRPYQNFAMWYDVPNADGEGDTDATGITGYFAGITTDSFAYPEQPLPDIFSEPTLKDFNYSQGYTGALDLTDARQIYHFESVSNNVNLTDFSGNNINLTSNDVSLQDTAFGDDFTTNSIWTWSSTVDSETVFEYDAVNDHIDIDDTGTNGVNQWLTYTLPFTIDTNTENFVLHYDTNYQISATGGTSKQTGVGFDSGFPSRSGNWIEGFYDNKNTGGNGRMQFHYTTTWSSASGIAVDGALFHAIFGDGTNITWKVYDSANDRTTDTSPRKTFGPFAIGVGEVEDTIFMTGREEGTGALTGYNDEFYLCKGSTTLTDCDFATVSGADIVTGVIDNGANIQDDGSHLNFTDNNNSIDGTGDFIFGTWINSTRTIEHPNHATLFSFGDTNDFEIRLGNSSLAVYSGSTEIKNETMSYDKHKHNHIIITRESGLWEFFVNGTEVGTDTTYATSIGSADNNLYHIGRDPDAIDSGFLNGTIDELFIGDGSLTSINPDHVYKRGTENWQNYYSLSNVTNAKITGLANGTFYYTGVWASNSNYNGSSAIANVTTDDIPDTPSLTALPVSKSQIDEISTAGASDNGDAVKDYGLRCEINKGTGWLTTVANSTLPVGRFYNYTGLTTGDVLTCQWRDGNAVGWSNWSANATATSWEQIGGNFYINFTQVGDALGITPRLELTSGVPDPTLTELRLINGSTTLQTNSSVAHTLTVNGTYDYFDNVYEGSLGTTGSTYLIEFDITNSTGTYTFTTNNTGSITQLFNPDYQEALTPTLADYNYTLSRVDEFVNLNVTRDNDSFVLNCNYIYAGNLDGEWINKSGTSYYYESFESPNSVINVYGRCYNPNSLVLTFNSFGNTTGSVVGLLDLDDQLGNWMGVPIVSLFVLLLASIATKSTSYMFSIFILVAIGIMGAIGLVTMDAGLWALIMIAGTLTTIGTKLGVG